MGPHASPDTAADRANSLSAVSCQSVSSCWAVGVSDATGNLQWQTLIELRSGAAWSVVPSPDVRSGQPNVLSGVACPAPTSCFAVDYHATAGNEPLVEEYTPGPAPSVPGWPWNGAAVALCALPGWWLARRRGSRTSTGGVER